MLYRKSVTHRCKSVTQKYKSVTHTSKSVTHACKSVAHKKEGISCEKCGEVIKLRKYKYIYSLHEEHLLPTVHVMQLRARPFS